MLENRRDLEEVLFSECEVKLAKKMIDTLRTTMEFLYYLMEHRNKITLSMILISSEGLPFESLLKKWKRNTDILFHIDGNIYVLICQSTDEEGARNFSKILLSNTHIHGGTNTYCVVSELNSRDYSIQDIIFMTLEQYMAIKEDNCTNQVNFTQFENEIKPISDLEEQKIYIPEA